MRNRPPDSFFTVFRGLMEAEAARGRSVEDVAKAMGVHRSRLYRYLEEADGPSGSTLAAMADYWGMTMDDLWHGRSRVVPVSPDEASRILELGDEARAAAERARPSERRRRSRRGGDPPPP